MGSCTTAIREPSGDHEGEEPPTRKAKPEPSALLVWTSLSIVNATRVPSGDNEGSSCPKASRRRP